jgi:hypothetical protein
VDFGSLGDPLPDGRAGQRLLEHGQQTAQLARHIRLRGSVELRHYLLRDMQAQISQDQGHSDHQWLIEGAPAPERPLAVWTSQPLCFVGWQVFFDFLEQVPKRFRWQAGEGLNHGGMLAQTAFCEHGLQPHSGGWIAVFNEALR